VKPARCLHVLVFTVCLAVGNLSYKPTDSSYVLDAVPKKRGPKTDVLEALLKRVDGLEKRLRTEDRPDSHSPTTPTKEAILEVLKSNEDSPPSVPQLVPELVPTSTSINVANGAPTVVPSSESYKLAPCADTACFLSNGINSVPATSHYPEVLLDTYFARIHGKPYHILDEASTRQRLLNNQLPNHLVFAIYAVSAR
jgi:hypothetical protein